MSRSATLPLPRHYDPQAVVDHSRWLDFQALQAAAIDWRSRHNLRPASTDKFKIGALGIDVQNTFCMECQCIQCI